MKRATIDVGSNSLLLLVSELQQGHWVPLQERTQVTGLGRGTLTTGLLSESAMAQSLATLREFFHSAREAGAEQCVAAGTMAVRMAQNQPEFLDRARQQGTPVIVLSGEDEADLGLRAVLNDPTFAQHRRISIIDPGGNSTELVTADRGQGVLFRRSFPVGALGLRDTILSDESPGFGPRLRAVEAVDDLLGMAYLPQTAGHAVTLGATGTNLISIRERMTSWQPERVHGAYLDFEEVSKAVAWMFDLSDRERAEITGIEPGRERTLHIGSLILERFLQCLHVLGCSVSVRGWRHALLEDDRYFA
ncbi:MAG TPA: hypothetical protein PLO61_06145 [Fimbriimonadaceae bacterium]|nr:hypothetical protein [Fimbriimonadaceae bacterium]HRJ33169.1 hypothetical protein [Fimbriimonadaceae bacterium]